MPTEDTSRWLIAPAPLENPRARVVLFPFAGAGAWQFRAWAADVPQNVEFLAVQSPGREDRFRDPLVSSADELIARCAPELAACCEVPTVFVGVSCGARFAHGAAMALRAARMPGPIRLVVINCHPTHVPGPLTRPLAQLGDDHLLAALRSLSGAPESFFRNEDLVRAFLPVVRNDIRIAEAMLAPSGTRLTCELIALHGTDDRDTSANEMTRWSELTAGGFDFMDVSGGHFFPLATRDPWFDVVRAGL